MKNWQVFAILAALCNASIGLFSKGAFHIGLSPQLVAFYKCVIAFLILTAIIFSKKSHRAQITSQLKQFWKILICAFFGIFTLYFFETNGYAHTLIATVVFILLGSSAITTFILSAILNKERMGKYQIIGLLLALMGVACMMHDHQMQFANIGALLAMIAGIGYGLFLTLSKKLNVDTSNLTFVWLLIGCGSLFLSVPVIAQHLSMPTLIDLKYLIPLSIIPTIGGYYFTSKALHYGTSSKVQLFELTEPLFASVMGFVFLHELMSDAQLLGAILILFAIFAFNKRVVGAEECANA